MQVKRRMSIKTPLDTSFYRPFARANKDAKNRAGGGNQTNLIFVAGALPLLYYTMPYCPGRYIDTKPSDTSLILCCIGRSFAEPTIDRRA